MKRLRAQLKGREFAAAHEAARALRAQYPGNRDVLSVLAVSLRCLDHIPEALEVLEELEHHHPTYSRLFEERGHCHLAHRAIDPAITAFSKAVTLNPWLPASLSALQDLYRMRGRLKESEAAARFAAKLEKLPREITAAHSMFADGEIHAAEELVRQYLQIHGDHIEGMRLLARIAMTHDMPYDAEILLEDVLRIAPDYRIARYEYAVALLGRNKHLRAREELEKLLAIDPGNRACRLAHAVVCARLGDYERALPAYQKLLSEAPGDAELHLAIGHALQTLGRIAEAINSYRAAAAVRPGYGRAYFSLANLKTYRFGNDELDQMIGYEADAETKPVDRYHLSFALGKALEDRGEYKRSFRYYERGNELKKLECGYRPDFFETNARLQVATCTREFFAARRGWGYPDAAPIFIVGLPRAGSTLIEQILASHSQVEGTMELANIPHLIGDLQDRTRPADNPRYPGVLAELTREDCARLGEMYIRDTLVYRHGKPFFTDKFPSNFRDLGFIHLILPNSRIIDARREAIACCFSNFKQLFPDRSGPQFAYGFEDLARYYAMYLQLMRHWDAVLPGRILRVQHEELVTDFSANVHRTLDFCKLTPEAACFEFHNTERAVHTPSAEQVRQPINRAGLDQWRHFEGWLGPLTEALVSLEVV
ncbi:MAG: tetratricopeptide repeat-containing sulfotransferase family protein [Steroidobacteraceae bacterium]